MRDESLKAIEAKFGVAPANIRSFFHYQPSFYHLHIHFVHTKMISKVSSYVGRAILLDDVIDNIKLYSPNKETGDYYQTKTLVTEVIDGTKLHTICSQNGIV